MSAKSISQKIVISTPEYLGQGPLVSNSLFGIHVKSNILSPLPQTDYDLIPPPPLCLLPRQIPHITIMPLISFYIQ